VAQNVLLVDPHRLKQNKDNPRLIFRQADMDALTDSIAHQGILVPLTVFSDGKSYQILDGERRWRCALKLALPRVPVVVQPKPPRLQNLMMMFAIHHSRTDWDPLPTAMKLAELEAEFKSVHKRAPNENELLGLASMSRGEVRRLKKLLGLPAYYRKELLNELRKPRSEQVLTVDHVLEATTAAAALRKRKIINSETEEKLRRAIVEKFRSKVINNTVAPRKLAKVARAVERNQVPKSAARRVIHQLIQRSDYTIDDAFRDSVEQVDFEHSLGQLAERVSNSLLEHRKRHYKKPTSLRRSLRRLQAEIREFLKS
jgi:ParB family transcriptional regulator, chromosome partitioning protein